MIYVIKTHIKNEEVYMSMNVSWFLGILLLIQQVNIPDQLVITNEGRPVAFVNRNDFSMPLPGIPIIDPGRYNKFLDQLDKSVSKEPKNASLDMAGNIVPEQVGYKLHRQVFTNKFYSYYFSKRPVELEIPRMLIYPKVDSELLGNIRSKTDWKVCHFL